MVPLKEIAPLLNHLVGTAAGETLPVPGNLQFEVETAKYGNDNMTELDHVGRRSLIACPDCGGVMWEISEDNGSHFRCHVGHAYEAEVMKLAHDEALSRALGTALRGYHERIALLGRMERQARERAQFLVAENWHDRAEESRKDAAVIHDAITRLEQIRESVLDETL